jgi:murein DD-endopeptidase MepM/ murein hydrolase activator NlpD
VIDTGGDRYIVLVHIEEGSATVQVGDLVPQGQQLAAVGNNGHSSAPHLHVHVQDTPSADVPADRTYPMHFRDVEITRGGSGRGVIAANSTPSTWYAHSSKSDDSIRRAF